MNVLTLLSLIGYCLAFCRFTKKPIEVSLFFIVTSIMLLFYLASLCEMLRLTAWVVLICGGLLLLTAPWYIEKNWKNFLSKYLTPGFLCSLLAILTFCLMAQHLLLSGEDELTHWGVVAKLIAYYHSLIPASTIIIHKSYPPGGALFYYLFFLFHGYSEGRAYFAQSLLCLAPLMLFTSNIKWAHWPRALGILFVAIISLHLLHADLGPYTSLYIDTSIGIYWGSIVVYARLFAKKPSDLLYLIPAACCLTLFKLGLALMLSLSLILVLSQQLLLNRKNLTRAWLIRIFLCVFAVFLAGFLTEKSWQWHLLNTHVAMEWKLRANAHQILSALNPQSATLRDKITTSHFIRALKKPLLLGLLFSLIASIITLVSKDQQTKKHLFASQILLWFGMTCYFLALLLLYLFSFTAGEGEGLASINRYASIYYMGWFLILYAEILIFSRNHLFRLIPNYVEKILGCFFIVVFVGGLFYSNHHQRSLLSNIRKTSHLKSVIQTITAPINKLTTANSRVFTVWQNSTGEARSMIVYNTVPRTPNLSYTSFGKPYNKNDQWTSNITPQQFLANLKNFDYLLLAHTDKNFWQHYGNVFPATPPTLRPNSIYYICIRPGFNGVNKRGCQLTAQKSYLFKIKHKHGKIALINLPMKKNTAYKQ